MTRRHPSGFTLTELLVVVAIMALVLVFVVPAANTMLAGTNMNRATQMVVDQLSLARQDAISLNRPVEVRFYKYHDPETPGTSSCFRALQAWEVVTANKFVPLEKVQALPAGVIMDSGTTLSSLLSRTGAIVVPPQPAAFSLPRVGTNYSYVAFRFTSSAGTDLLPTGGPPPPWFITLHAEQPLGDGLSTPPPNFVTIQIDPVSGTLQFFRPGVTSS